MEYIAADRKDELDAELRKYKLDDLLFLLAKKSQEMYKQENALQEVTWSRPIGELSERFKQLMPVWVLAELSYRAILNSNDYRHIKPDVSDIAKLNNIFSKVSDELTGRKLENKDVKETAIDIYLGLSQTQFWWQELIQKKKMIFYNFLRYYLLLSEIPKDFPGSVRPNDDLREITGFGIEEFSKLLCAGYSWNYTNSPELGTVNVDKDITKGNPIVTSANLQKCFELFAEKYSYYRKTHSNNPLFLKPIVKTDTGRLIISNAFIWAKKLYEGIYWIIRDKYANLKSTDFTSAFGNYYEEYIKRLLTHYLQPRQFEKLDEQGKADWLIYTNKYLLIVEQKSSLMSISLKREYPSAEGFREYLEKFKSACNQLKRTEGVINKGKRTTIMLILHFERLFFKEVFVKKELEKLCKEDIGDLRRYYMVDTEEFEQLIQTLSEGDNNLDRIISKMLCNEEKPPSPARGRDMRAIIEDNLGWNKIKFLEQYSYIFNNVFGQTGS